MCTAVCFDNILFLINPPQPQPYPLSLHRFVALGTSTGELLKVSWEGQLLGRAILTSDHTLLRPWGGLDHFPSPALSLAFSGRLPIQPLPRAAARARDIHGKGGSANPLSSAASSSDSAAAAADEAAGEATTPCAGDSISSCHWSESLRVFALQLTDGSVLFLQVLPILEDQKDYQ